MVVVEMTSKTPSYRYSEGGSFSFFMETYDKPFKTYEELIEIMRSRHIEVNNKEFAILAMQNFSYYGIVNGYKNTFLQVPGTDCFIPGTQFEELYTLHIIDTALNNILFKYILYLEKALKSRLSYLISQKYGVYTDWNDFTCSNSSDYLYKNYYSNSNNRRSNILRSLKEQVLYTHKNPSMEHYKQNKNHIPAWILTTNITYGLAIEWYNILKSDDKKAICNSFITSFSLSDVEIKEFVRKTFDLTKEYRNKIAHGNRTFSVLPLPQLPKKQLLTLTYNTVSEEEYNNGMGQTNTMAVLLSLVTMLPDPYLFKNLFADLINLIETYRDKHFNQRTVFEVLGFPNDLFSRLLELYKKKYTDYTL